MRVKVYQYTEGKPEEFLTECDLTEALPTPDAEQALAYQELRDHGRCWVGGGASPLILLMRVRE